MAYTKVTKPSGTSYTNISGGSYLYDDSATVFDSALLYDGVAGSYTNLTKPAFSLVTIPAGSATGLLMSPTYPQAITVGKDPYTYINKPS